MENALYDEVCYKNIDFIDNFILKNILLDSLK
jgi:hypothetical protein